MVVDELLPICLNVDRNKNNLLYVCVCIHANHLRIAFSCLAEMIRMCLIPIGKCYTQTHTHTHMYMVGMEKNLIWFIYAILDR